MMSILIAFATRHGSTRGIAEAIAEQLEAGGHETTLAEVSTVSSLDPFAVVVLGSGVYMGHWLPQARQFIDRHREALATRPTWLFSSGPLGDQDTADTIELDALTALVGAREHRIFTGRLDRSSLGFAERMAVRMVRAPEGDYRNWPAIRDWAARIDDALGANSPVRRDDRTRPAILSQNRRGRAVL